MKECIPLIHLKYLAHYYVVQYHQIYITYFEVIKTDTLTNQIYWKIKTEVVKFKIKEMWSKYIAGAIDQNQL